MRITDIKKIAADLKAVTVGSAHGATGPRSEHGKFRSALNAVKHGLAGQHVLLPGENRESYEERLDGVFTSIGPTNEAEAQLAALAGDDMWKLERLGKIEHGVILGRIEELLGLTEASERATTSMGLIAVLGSALTTFEQLPFPIQGSPELTRRLNALSNAIEHIGSAVSTVPVELIQACDQHVRVLLDSTTMASWFATTCAAVDQAARTMMAMLLKQGDRDQATQETLRTAIATIALPDEVELKKLARYRKLLEEGLQRRLQALDQLRKVTATSSTTSEAADKSREFRVKLRLVG